MGIDILNLCAFLTDQKEKKNIFLDSFTGIPEWSILGFFVMC
jgi:hypothetical protein